MSNCSAMHLVTSCSCMFPRPCARQSNMFRVASATTLRATRCFSTSIPRYNAAVQPEIRTRLKDALKTAMKGKDKEATGCIRVSKDR